MAEGNLQNWRYTIVATNTEEALPFESVAGVTGGSLKALAGNSGEVRLGETTKAGANNGYPLDPGDSIDISEILNPSRLKIQGTLGDKIAFIGTHR